ncbi:MAG: divalent-cation tolerance protein CutA [Acidobacteria bacterium]|nr:divalent-cation tolerance protein CutA [Acidobacteriota bacterium]MBI1983376.1 divalent-cation tolerance protein CutA [Acidobacteriota bacterium]
MGLCDIAGLLYLCPTTCAIIPAPIEGGVVTDKVVIMVTAASRRECRKIARRLVEAKLAACVNITQGIESIYRWEGKLADEKEFVMLIKSTRGLFSQIKTEISKIHSYHTPEIICLPIIDGSRNYLQWVGDSVKPSSSGERG